jgi:hypothetical protein
MEIKRLNPSRPASYQRLCHDSEVPRYLLDFARNPDLAERLAELRLSGSSASSTLPTRSYRTTTRKPACRGSLMLLHGW